MKTEKKEKQYHIPKPGQRILRSVCAVCLCFVIYFLRGRQGIPFYSALAVLQCMQPYRESSLQMAKKRTIGTFTGAFWGMVVILIEVYVLNGKLQNTFWSYLLIALFTGVVLYSTVLLEITNTSYFSCVVFLSITVMHITDESPLLFVFNRVLDTLIGIALALVVNTVHLPRTKNTDILFVSGIDDTLLTDKEKMTPYSKIELNRMVEQGAKFTVSTLRTPATVRETLPGVNFKLPIIAMDGAVLYDMNENAYLMSYQMSYLQAKRIIAFLENEHISYFANVVVDDVLVIYYNELGNRAEKDIYRQMRKSPYRNYIKRALPENENVVYIMVVEEKARMEQLYDKLRAQDWADEHKILIYDSTDYPGYAYIKIYHKDETRENMLKNLMALLNVEKVVSFGSIEGKSDVYVEDSNKNIMVKKMKQLFEPVSIGSMNKKR